MQNIFVSVKVKSGPGVSNSCVLSHDKTLSFGRMEANDCVLSNDAGISRKHFEIYFESGKCWIKDLNSRNGTYVNNHSILSSELKAGDEIRIGGTRLIVNLSNSQNKTTTPSGSRLEPKSRLLIRDNDATTVIANRHLHSGKINRNLVVNSQFAKMFFDLPGSAVLISGPTAKRFFDRDGLNCVRIQENACVAFPVELAPLAAIVAAQYGANALILLNHTCARTQFISHVTKSMSKFSSPQAFLAEYMELPQELSNALLDGIDLAVCESTEPDTATAIFEKRHSEWMGEIIKNSKLLPPTA